MNPYRGQLHQPPQPPYQARQQEQQPSQQQQSSPSAGNEQQQQQQQGGIAAWSHNTHQHIEPHNVQPHHHQHQHRHPSLQYQSASHQYATSPVNNIYQQRQHHPSGQTQTQHQLHTSATTLTGQASSPVIAHHAGISDRIIESFGSGSQAPSSVDHRLTYQYPSTDPHLRHAGDPQSSNFDVQMDSRQFPSLLQSRQYPLQQSNELQQQQFQHPPQRQHQQHDQRSTYQQQLSNFVPSPPHAGSLSLQSASAPHQRFPISTSNSSTSSLPRQTQPLISEEPNALRSAPQVQGRSSSQPSSWPSAGLSSRSIMKAPPPQDRAPKSAAAVLSSSAPGASSSGANKSNTTSADPDSSSTPATTSRSEGSNRPRAAAPPSSATSDASPSATAGTLAAARQRKTIAQSACEVCRRKRTKCVIEPGSSDCSTCRSSRVECVFSGVDKRKESVRDLRSRLGQLEALLGAVQGSRTQRDRDRLVQGITEGHRSIEDIVASSSTAAATSAKVEPETPGMPTPERKEINLPSTSDTTTLKRARPLMTGSPSVSPSADELASSDDDVPGTGKITASTGDMRWRAAGGADSHSTHNDLLNFAQSADGNVDGTDNDDDELLEATLSALTDRLTISTDGTIRAISAVSNLGFASTTKSIDRSKTYEQTFRFGDGTLPSKADFDAANTIELGPGIILPSGTTVETVRQLLALYFIWELPQHPILSRPAFLAHMKTGGPYFSSLLLNSILAWSSSMSNLPAARTDLNNPYTAGDGFARLAEELYEAQIDSLGGTPCLPITTVQALVLMAVRLYATGRELKAWLHMGACARAALDAGLHLDATAFLDTNHADNNALTPDDLYVRSRAFHGVWYSEQEFCSLFGRTGVIRDIVITCPSFETFDTPWSRMEEFDWWATLNSGSLSHLSSPQLPAESVSVLWPLARRLADCFARSMRVIYYRVASDNPHVTKEHRRRSLDKVMARTRRVMSELPPAPLLDEHQNNESNIRPPVVFLMHLHLVAHSHVILLNRPFMDYFDDPGFEDSPRSRCISSALSILQLIRQWKQCWSGGLQTAGNGNTHVLLSAATIFLYELSKGPDVVGTATSRTDTIMQTGNTSSTFEERQQFARLKLEAEVIPYLREMALYRPGPLEYLKKITDALQETLEGQQPRMEPGGQLDKSEDSIRFIRARVDSAASSSSMRPPSWAMSSLVPDHSQYTQSLFVTSGEPTSFGRSHWGLPYAPHPGGIPMDTPGWTTMAVQPHQISHASPAGQPIGLPLDHINSTTSSTGVFRSTVPNFNAFRADATLSPPSVAVDGQGPFDLYDVYAVHQEQPGSNQS